MSMKQDAFDFFDAVETGGGWDACKGWCHSGATFAAQADALAGIGTVEAYAEWMKGLLVPVPNGRYELTSFAVDEERGTVCAAAVFHGTHTVAPDGGTPSGKTAASDYCYVITFEGGKISHMVKIWNDGHALKQLGWA